MSEPKKNGAARAAAAILGLVGAANFGNAAYRMSQGADMSPPLVIAGVACLTLAAVLSARKR